MNEGVATGVIVITIITEVTVRKVSIVGTVDIIVTVTTLPL